MSQEIKNIIKEEIEKIKYGQVLSEGMRFHMENDISFYNNIYRFGTEKYYNLFKEMKTLWKNGKLTLNKEDTELVLTDIGDFGLFEGNLVPLDLPLEYKEEFLDEAEYKGKEVQLNKPKRGGSKKFYVYVKCGDTVRKISFGSPDMSIKISKPERRKAFVARHRCKEKSDKCTAGYWACRIGRYPHLTGSKKAYTWW